MNLFKHFNFKFLFYKITSTGFHTVKTTHRKPSVKFSIIYAENTK